MRTIYNGDCRKMELEDESVQMVVTSPPYWGLRKYSGVPDLVWGDSECKHDWQETDVTYARGDANTGGQPGVGAKRIPLAEKATHGTCSLCGAWKGQYGLEPTPEMYVDHTIIILREIRRVLRKDGVVFWNIGDSYNGSGGDHKPGGKNDAGFQGETFRGVQPKNARTLKPKDLCLIPFRVAIAAQEDG